MMIKITNSLPKLTVLILLAGLMTACGPKRVAPEEAVVANTKDITRPPSVTKDRAPSETESNPDETISYDEWRRRREAQQIETDDVTSPDL